MCGLPPKGGMSMSLYGGGGCPCELRAASIPRGAKEKRGLAVSLQGAPDGRELGQQTPWSPSGQGIH